MSDTEILRRQRLPGVIIDGVLYVSVGLLISMQAIVSGDEAAKYISAQNLFWLKSGMVGLSSIALNLKMYRSTAFADNKRAKEGEVPPIRVPATQIDAPK